MGNSKKGNHAQIFRKIYADKRISQATQDTNNNFNCSQELLSQIHKALRIDRGPFEI
jgi:hypothetical protein